MHVIRLSGAGRDFTYKWPSEQENYPHWVDYLVSDEGSERAARVGFGSRPVYGRPRARVVVWVDGKPEAEFLGTDDHDQTGDLVCELKAEGNKILRYPEDPIPAKYKDFTVIPLPSRVTGEYVRSAWAVLCNVSDHQTLLRLADIRRRDRGH